MLHFLASSFGENRMPNAEEAYRPNALDIHRYKCTTELVNAREVFHGAPATVDLSSSLPSPE